MAGTTTNPSDKADQALDGIAGIAPPDADTVTEKAGAGADFADHTPPPVREGADAETVTELKDDPSDADAKLHVELDETFPGSDAPSTTRPGTSEPAPSSGYDPEAEAEIQKSR